MSQPNIDTMMRPDLVKYLTDELGHTRSFVQYMSIEKMRELAHSGKRFDVPTPEAKPAATPSTDTKQGRKLDSLISALSEDLAEDVKAKLWPDIIELTTTKPRELTITVNLADAVKKVDVGYAHKRFPELLQWSVAGIHVYLYGPAGSGKTTAGIQLAKALSELTGEVIPFYFTSFHRTSQVFEITGFENVHGKVARTPTREAWENGGVILWDEYDANEAIGAACNTALANDIMLFPDGPIKRHRHCYIIAAGNTIGKGATAEYVSRDRQDAATLNRFAFIEWDYDADLELAAAGEDAREWVKHVQKLRAAHRSLGASAPDILISPRASIYGARMLRANPKTTYAMLEEALIWQGASEDDKAKVRKAVRA